MVLLVDDLLSFPLEIFEVVFNTIAQTAYKGAWTDYRRRLSIQLMRLHRDYEEGKISKRSMKSIERTIFKEMRLANSILESAPADGAR